MNFAALRFFPKEDLEEKEGYGNIAGCLKNPSFGAIFRCSNRLAQFDFRPSAQDYRDTSRLMNGKSRKSRLRPCSRIFSEKLDKLPPFAANLPL